MVYNFDTLTVEEAVYELNHLEDLTLLVNKRGRIPTEVNDLRDRIKRYSKRIERNNLLSSSSNIINLVNFLKKF